MNNLKISTTELAKICGVSQGTVDRALNNRTGINIKTKERIVSTAIKYGYRPKKSEEKIIGVIVFNLNNEFFTELITNIEKTAYENNYSAVVMFTNYSEEHEIECILKMYSMGVDGIIICPINSGAEFSNFINGLNIPIVCVGNKIPGCTYVGIDDYGAMKELTKSIVTDDFENIIYFSPSLKYRNSYAQMQRFKGFAETLKDKSFSVISNFSDLNESYNKKTVIICSTDYYAVKVYLKVKNAEITGFDGIKLLKKFNINITTVAYSNEEIAKYTFSALKTGKSKIIDYRVVLKRGAV